MFFFFFCGFFSASFTFSIQNFFVCETNFTTGTPVNGHFVFVGESFFIQLKKYPLGPFVVMRIGGVDFSIPVEGESDGFELSSERIDVLVGGDAWMNIVFYGIVFCWKSEGIPSDGIENVFAFHSFFSGNDI